MNNSHMKLMGQGSSHQACLSWTNMEGSLVPVAHAINDVSEKNGHTVTRVTQVVYDSSFDPLPRGSLIGTAEQRL